MGKEIRYKKGANCITFCCQETSEESSEIHIRDDINLTELNKVLYFAARFASTVKYSKSFKT